MYHPETCHIRFCSSPSPALSCPRTTPSHRRIPVLPAKWNSAAGSQSGFFPSYFLWKRDSSEVGDALQRGASPSALQSPTSGSTQTGRDREKKHAGACTVFVWGTAHARLSAPSLLLQGPVPSRDTHIHTGLGARLPWLDVSPPGITLY